MSKYIIISKDKKGNKYGEIYNITYQIDGYDTQRFKIDLLCRGIVDGQVAYCYLAGKEGFGVKTNKEKDEFIKEFYKFQKGGSYRKTHPINESETELIEKQIVVAKNNIEELKDKLKKIQNEKRNQQYEHYYDDVNMSDLDKYIKGIIKSMQSKKYYLSGIEFNIFEGHRIFICDKVTNKPIKIITIRDGKIDAKNLEKNDIKIE